MNDLVDLKNIKKQTDGTWSTRAVADIPGFVPSKFYSQLNAIEDLSSDNGKLIELDESHEQSMMFSPQRVNLLRAFQWEPRQRVLEVGCSSGCVTRYLAEKELVIDAVEPNRQLAQLAEIRTKEFKQVRIFSEQFSDVDFGNRNYDIVIINGVTDCVNNQMSSNKDSYQQQLNEFLIKCKTLLTEQGRIFLAADNRQGLKYIYGATDERVMKSYYGFDGYEKQDLKQALNLSQWRELISQLPFQQVQEYYLFPDFRFATVLLGKEYCLSNPFAFQHLEGIRSKDYFQHQTFGGNEVLLYQAANGHGHLGDFANSCLFVLENKRSDLADRLDFAHFPGFTRKPEFTCVVKKNSNEDFVCRSKLRSDPNDFKNETEHDAYYQGCQLSVRWRNSILSDPRGIGFEQYLLGYLDFLKKLESGVLSGMNIDAIANNVIVDSDGEYHLIDLEWLESDQEIDTEFVFYRAIVHFALRNNSIFHYFCWLNHISTLGDFLIYCFKAVGLAPSLKDLDNLRSRDCNFLEAVLHNVVEYQLSDRVGTSASTRQIIPFIRWRDEGEYYNHQQIVYCKANADSEKQSLIFNLPEQNRKVEAIRIFPFEDLRAASAGYFSIEKLTIVAVDKSNNQDEVLSLATSDDINSANMHKGVFYAKKDGDSLFMFNNNNTFLEFELPDYKSNENKRLQIEMSFRVSPSHDYELARHKFGLVERKLADNLKLKDEQIQSLNKKFNKQTKELKEMQASRIWRLLAAYRDTFKISGYPEKNIFGKIFLFVKRFKHSKKIK